MVALGLAIFAFAPGIASAQFLDPATLHIGPGTPGGDPVQIGNTGDVTVSQNSGGATPLDQNYQLILAVANSTNCPTLTSINGTTVSLAGDDRGTVGPGQDVYTVLGIAGNNSVSFTNMQAADLAINGINATFFGLCVYNLDSFTTILGTQSGKQTDAFTFSGLNVGTFAVAYGEDTSSSLAYTSPFTEAGLTTGVPEPSTLAIAGLGVLGFVGYGLRRRVKK